MIKQLNKGLKLSIDNREIETKNKIKKAIDSLRMKQKVITVSSISREGNISRPTVYKYHCYVEELIPLKVTKNNDLKKLEKKIKEQKTIIENQRKDINTLKYENKKLIEEMISMKEYIISNK